WTAGAARLLGAVRWRVARGPARFALLVPNPSEHAEIKDDERRRHHGEAGRVLALALPLIEDAAGAPVEGSVSIRHDPMDAIEETLRSGDFQEVIVATAPHGVSSWLHADLPHRVAHLGLPVTTVTVQHREAAPVPA